MEPLFKGTTVTIHVKDLAKARAFYKDTLGLPENYYAPASDMAEYRLPGPVALGIHQTFPGHTGRPPGTVTGIVLAVDDVPGTVRALKKRGVAITDEPEKFDWGTVATFADPEGNEYVVMSTPER
jgi:predicted enzyme related to lactoylglutathione lyase